MKIKTYSLRLDLKMRACLYSQTILKNNISFFLAQVYKDIDFPLLLFIVVPCLKLDHEFLFTGFVLSSCIFKTMTISSS